MMENTPKKQKILRTGLLENTMSSQNENVNIAQGELVGVAFAMSHSGARR
jgi:hypothetical protein